MKKRITYRMAALVLTLGVVHAAYSRPPNIVSEDTTQQPNILIIMADQLIPFLMGTYGHSVVNTPHLNQLAQRGVRFDAAYTPNPICAPARACLVTGKYSAHNKVYDNAAPLYCDEPTLGHYLANAGYETALSGKMHFVGPDQWHGFGQRFIPNIYPADFRWTKSRDQKTPASHARSYQGESVEIVPAGVDLTYDQAGNLRFVNPGTEQASELTASAQSGFNTSHNSKFDKMAHFKALEYLEAKRAATSPFMLCVSYNFPHEPFHPPQELWEMYQDAEITLPELPDTLAETYSVMDKWLNRHHGLENYDIQDPESLKRLRRAYYALVTYVDIMVGELLKSLEENGLDDNTIILFTSDHGDMLGEKGMVQKRSFYEWSARIPLLITYPDQRYAGTVVREPVSLVDLLPTVLDMAGVEGGARLPMDGQSLVGLMDGRDQEPRVAFSEMHSEGVYSTCFMVRKGNYKYNYFHEHGAQLFDLEADPGEWNDLAEDPAYRKIAEELKGLIFATFDPDALEQELRASLARRFMIQQAIEKQNVRWDFKPPAAQ